MSQPAIKGQEVSISITVGGALQTQIDSVQSAEIEWELDLLEEGYLGEFSDRVDNVFKLMRVSLTVHLTSEDYLALADAIVARAQRRAGGAPQIDVIGTFRFPNGDIPTLLIPDVSFESIPLNIGGRDEYVEQTLSGKASSYQLLT
jgi:hypothetical protein